MIAGMGAAAETFQQTGAERYESLVGEGAWADDVPYDVAVVSGSARVILLGERTALNLLGYLSGIATTSYRFAGAAQKGGARRRRGARRPRGGGRLLAFPRPADFISVGAITHSAPALDLSLLLETA
ncbi:MAG: hypothetical protein M3331_07880 [Actinomycetota bacterium]|nr:hypothetical protein [Actinomycetota bacterium]